MKQPRLNNFLLGFIACLGMLFLMGLTQNSVRFQDETSIAKEFDNLYKNVQGKGFNVETSTPVYQDFREGEIMFVNSNGTQHLITRIGNKLYKALLTEI